MKARPCSLTGEAFRQPAEPAVFFLKDINPRKPNRWLALPRAVGAGMQSIHDFTSDEQADFWKSAVRKAEELFGSSWGLAYNGDKVRTQCHFHVHMGRFIAAAESGDFVLIRSVEQIRAKPGDGLWVHPVPGGYHLHAGEQTTETVLVR